MTEKIGLSEADQAYADPKTLGNSQYPRDVDSDMPKNWPLKLDTGGFRLLTESEWEIAATLGTRTIYGFGSDESLLERYAWLQTNSDRQTHTTKELRPNFRGLFDLHGNTHDWYASYPLGNVIGDPVGSTAGSSRVSRGGNWSCRSDRDRGAAWRRFPLDDERVLQPR